MDRVVVKYSGGPRPGYKTPGSSGADLCARIDHDITIPPGGWALIPTGIRVQIPPGYEGQVRPRSGLALKNGIGMLNSPGTIDSDYRGEIKVILFNFGREEFVVRDGDRIAQLVITQIARAEFVPGNIDETARSEGGFGSTGV